MLQHRVSLAELQNPGASITSSQRFSYFFISFFVLSVANMHRKGTVPRDVPKWTFRTNGSALTFPLQGGVMNSEPGYSLSVTL